MRLRLLSKLSAKSKPLKCAKFFQREIQVGCKWQEDKSALSNKVWLSAVMLILTMSHNFRVSFSELNVFKLRCSTCSAYKASSFLISVHFYSFAGYHHQIENIWASVCFHQLHIHKLWRSEKERTFFLIQEWLGIISPEAQCLVICTSTFSTFMVG